MSKLKSKKKVIGITTGDPKGIGPEVVSKALEDKEIKTLTEFRIFGSLESRPTLPDDVAAEMTLASLKEATQAALQGDIQALVTGPLNKARLQKIDRSFLGHTEFFAKTCVSFVAALFVARNWRVALATRHLPLHQVPLKLNAVDILKTIRLTVEALQKYFHVGAPRIAVAGLNPHAGEKGLFGDEEEKIIWPAIHQAQKEGCDVWGPFSPDTLFWQMTEGRFDAVIAMYHDQGLIPLKTLSFRETVQMTLGLPFLRVSVDHGTAEDLVGTGKADPFNMKNAIRLVCELTR